MLMATDEFSSHTTGKEFKVKFPTSCKSSNVIYLFTCRRCGLQYAGETGQPLYMRMNGHQYGPSVVEHFNSGTHEGSDMAGMGIEFA